MTDHVNACNEATTILLAAETPTLQHGMRHLLKKEGFEVLVAADGREALTTLRKASRPPDLIVSDINLPPQDGFEFLRAIRSNRAWLTIPFLFLTDRHELERVRQGYLLGADDCLVTPMDRERFLLIIHSKLKRYTELREQIEKQQRKLDEAKRAFTSMVAHELRTPLSSISMAADILGRQLNGQGLPEIREMLDIVQGGSVRMGRVVEQMVLYVMLESGALEEAIGAYTYPSLVRDAVIGAIDRARQFHYRGWKNLVHFNELDPGVLVRCDLATLKHALAEVISNAMTFADPDQPIQVTQWVSDGQVWVTVTDYGPGIPAEDLPHVFEPYRQVERQRHEQQGIGMGLPLARGIIQAHHGNFELCSVVDRGTQVIISVPVYQDSTAGEELAAGA
ncbi:MAG: ATP-binding protein [Chloroflexota bacterium]|jgi:signal transduction histidine kinase